MEIETEFTTHAHSQAKCLLQRSPRACEEQIASWVAHECELSLHRTVTDNSVVLPITPMLVTSGPLPPDSDRYAFEVKWDGFRWSLIQASPKGVTVWSRNGYDMTGGYPELQNLSGALDRSVFLDGEIVVLDEVGKPDFAALWFRCRGSSESPVCFMAFDVLRWTIRA